MATLPQTPPHRRRRFLPRLSLRSLMLFVLILGGGLGYVVHRADVQRRAVAAIVAGGGQVNYDWQEDQSLLWGSQGPWPQWLVKAIGPDYFGSVTAVNYSNDFKSISLPAIGQLTGLRRLNIWSPSPEAARIKDADFAHLSGLTALEDLDLSGLGLDGSALAHLRNATRLRQLSLHDRTISANALRHLANFPRLKHLSLGAWLTDDSLRHLEGLTELEGLDLGWTRITDAGLAHLRPLVKLQTLRVGGRSITSRGLVHLSDLTRLVSLDLSGTGVTSLEAIRNLTRLERLDLSRTGVTSLEPIRNATRLEYLELLDTPIDDAGFAAVEGFTKLSELRVGGSNRISVSTLGDAGLVHLRPLINLRRLYVGTNHVTGAGLVHLAGLTRLDTLNLSDNPIGDDGMPYLAGLQSVRNLNLNLNGTDVGDEGLRSLVRMTGLNRVNLGGTRVTDAGLLWLAQNAPVGLGGVNTEDTEVTEVGRTLASEIRPGFRGNQAWPGLCTMYLHHRRKSPNRP